MNNKTVNTQELMITGEVSVIPICALFRYTEEELLTEKISRKTSDSNIINETEKLLLRGIDLSKYGFVDPENQCIKPLDINKLREPSEIRISNELVLKILENGANNLTGGIEAIYNTGKRVIELIPNLRKQLLHMKVLPPSLFLHSMKKLSTKFSTKTIDIEFINRNSMYVNLYYPMELTKSGKNLTTKARCAGFRGAMEAILMFMELDDVRVEETACVADGADCCEFELNWTPPKIKNRLKNLILFSFFRELVLSFQHAEMLKDHEIFVITANLIAEQKKLESALRNLDIANKELERLSTIDGLTELRNRRFFDSELKRIYKIMARDSQKFLSLILIDIDHFKKINDEFGHQAGDRSLRKIAAIIKEFARRPEDFAARYGGEEFALVLPHTDEKDALAIAESIRKTVEESIICRPEPAHTITISIGIGSRIFNKNNTTTIDDLVYNADTNLYKAKAEGRNRVIMAKTK